MANGRKATMKEKSEMLDDYEPKRDILGRAYICSDVKLAVDTLREKLCEERKRCRTAQFCKDDNEENEHREYEAGFLRGRFVGAEVALGILEEVESNWVYED